MANLSAVFGAESAGLTSLGALVPRQMENSGQVKLSLEALTQSTGLHHARHIFSPNF
jgi:hypothetical protein